MNFMPDTLPGLIVERAIPSDVLGGLMMGRYRLHGGVVRWESGTPNAGQILRHLLPVSMLLSVYFIFSFNPVSGFTMTMCNSKNP